MSKIRVSVFYPSNTGALVKREILRNFNNRTEKLNFLNALDVEQVAVLYCRHSLRFNLWVRELNSKLNFNFQIFPRNKVICVCRNNDIANENLKEIVENDLWKTSRLGSSY